MTSDLRKLLSEARDALRNELCFDLLSRIDAALAEPVEPVAWIQPDHLAKAREAAFLCRVEPKQRDDFVPIYAAPADQDRADAERYRFLRKQHEFDDDQASNNNYGKNYPPRTMCVFQDDGADGLEPVKCDPGALDEAIDTARIAK